MIIGVAGIFVIPREASRDEDTEAHASSVDWIGAFLYTSGTLLLLTGLSEGVSQGWKTPFIIALLVLSFLFLAIFVFWQLNLERGGLSEPLMRLSIFSNAKFSVAMAVVCLFSAGFMNWLIYCTYLYALLSLPRKCLANFGLVTRITSCCLLFRQLCDFFRLDFWAVRNDLSCQ